MDNNHPIWSLVVWSNEEHAPPSDLKPEDRYAVKTGLLCIGDLELKCAVLNDGTRVFYGDTIDQLIGGLGGQ